MTLPGPPLNISGGFFPGSIHSSFYGRDWQDPRTGEKPFRDEDRVRYVYVSRSEVYDREYISEHGKCQPSSSEVSELLKPVVHLPFLYPHLGGEAQTKRQCTATRV